MSGGGEGGRKPVKLKIRKKVDMGRNLNKLFDYMSGEQGVSLQGQSTRTSSSVLFWKTSSEIVQINEAEKRD